METEGATHDPPDPSIPSYRTKGESDIVRPAKGGVIKNKLSPTNRLLEAQAHAIHKLEVEVEQTTSLLLILIETLGLIAKGQKHKHDLTALVYARQNRN